MINYITGIISNAAAQSAANGITSAIVLLIIIALLISLAIFSLFVAVGTYVVKRVWFSDWGGNPRKYR